MVNAGVLALYAIVFGHLLIISLLPLQTSPVRPKSALGPKHGEVVLLGMAQKSLPGKIVQAQMSLVVILPYCVKWYLL